MHVGRLPVGNVTELTSLVEKIIAYEDFSEGDWRNRALFISDDEWSPKPSSTQPYCCDGREEIFRDAGRGSIDLIREEGRLANFVADSFFVYAYMDTVLALERCQVDPQTGDCLFGSDGDIICNPRPPVDAEARNRDYGEKTVAPILWNFMRRGYLMVSYNGHANARLMTHEYIFRHSRHTREDVDNVTNSRKPFVFAGYGCHLAEFSAHNEGQYGIADGISESLLFAAERGAIACIASTGYEWLGETEGYNLAVVAAFFKNPPRHEGHTRWVLGEIFSRSKLNIVSRSSSLNSLSMSATYTLLGDPGLIMDAAPPRMAIVVDGMPVESGVALSLPADQDSILFEVAVRDEIWARSFGIEDVGGSVDPERFTVVPDSSDDRSFGVSYRTTILPRPYEIKLSAQDANGLVSTASFPVRLETDFQLRRLDGDWIDLTDGELVTKDDSIRVKVCLQRYVTSEDLSLYLDDQPMVVRKQARGPVQDGRATEWTLTALEQIVEEGDNVISLRVRQPDGGEYPVSVAIQNRESFEIGEVFNFPNPFIDETLIHYFLGARADEVSVKIYANSGKHVATLRDLPVFPGENWFPWDGTDEDGDQVSNGLYFYKVFVKYSVGNTRKMVTEIEKMARAR
jgi:hypothetical protein